MKKLLSTFALILSTLVFFENTTATACTSAIVGARRAKNGHAMLWKHRDTGTEHNFIDRVESPGNLTFVALFNGGDSLRNEAWMGMNEAGFAIMNTASYNLMPDTSTYKDREGEVMRKALERCKTIDDFMVLLDTLPKPLGVQANFGVIDASGNGGYFETDDFKYTPFLLNDSTDLIVRTNYSFTGNDSTGMGYIRYDNACQLIDCLEDPQNISASDFTENLSRSFYHSLLNHDYLSESETKYIIDQDFIPRRLSSASIVIESADLPSDYIMWTVLGYPPVSSVECVTLRNVPESVLPTEPGLKAKACNDAIKLKHEAFDIKRGSGNRYVNLDFLRKIIPVKRAQSMSVYQQYKK